MIKMLSKLGTKGEALQLIQGSCATLQGEGEGEGRAKGSGPAAPANIAPEAFTGQQSKKKKDRIRVTRKERKLLWFPDNMIVYVENPKELQKQLRQKDN